VTEKKRVPNFPCPFCGGKSVVKDSRPGTIAGASAVRRRRTCLDCHQRWSTFEHIIGGGRMEQHISHMARAVNVAIAALKNVQAEVSKVSTDDHRQMQLELAAKK
jgi:transcriptional regulator NrdR family protein